MNDKKLLEIFLKAAPIEALSGNEKPLADFISRYLSELGFMPIEDESKSITQSNSGNIICKIGNGGDFLLSAHMDTARSTKDVNPILSTDRITSDGKTVLGVDNRVGVSILLRVAELMSKKEIKSRDCTLVFITCEETTLGGSKNLKLNDSIKSGYVFDSYMRPGKFISSSYGAAAYNIEIFGKASHSGINPEGGINAIKIAANAISKLKLGRIKNDTLVNIGSINGGVAINVVPDYVKMIGEVRAIEMQEVESQLSEIEKIFINECALLNGKLNFDWYWDFQPFKLKNDSQTVKRISQAINNIGLKPEASISAGGSDANSYNAKGIETVNIGIGAQNPHSNDEFILYEDFENALKIAIELVKNET